MTFLCYVGVTLWLYDLLFPFRAALDNKQNHLFDYSLDIIVSTLAQFPVFITDLANGATAS